MKPLVIYHDHCTDGFGAAFAAWCKLGDDAEYLPMSYGSDDPLRDVIFEGRTVYVLDFSFDKMTTESLLDECAMFVWLDHHKSAFEMWCRDGERERFEDEGPWQKGNPYNNYILLDNNKSGAMLAWEYFHPEKTVPELIKYIDDRDRWVFHYGASSKALHAALQTMQPWDFTRWRELLQIDALVDALNEGFVILNVYDHQIQGRVKVAAKCDINGMYQGLAVNSPVHQSEIGNELAKASCTFGLVWYFDSSTKRANVSLRSIGDYDVSVIAKTFGGGGHRNAAGMSVSMEELLKWLL